MRRCGMDVRGANVTLRPVSTDHVAWLTELFTLPEVAEAWPGDNVSGLQAMVDGTGDALGLVVELRGSLIGFIQYYEEPDPNYRHAGIDIVLHPDWCNQGLGTDALRALARHLIEELGHHRIIIDPRATNARAISSYRKVGFRDIGLIRRYERGNDGLWHDSLLMDLLPEDLSFPHPADSASSSLQHGASRGGRNVGPAVASAIKATERPKSTAKKDLEPQGPVIASGDADAV